MSGSATDHLFMVGSGLKVEGVATASSTCLLNDNRDDSGGGAVFFSSASSSVRQPEAGKLYYVQNPDFSHGYSCSDAASSVTVLYTAPVSGGGGAIPSAVHHEQLMLPCSQMIQEQCFVPLLPAQETQETTHLIRDLRTSPVYANQGSPNVYPKTSATAIQAHGNWWNGTNVQEHLLQAGTEDAAGRARLHDLGQLPRETLVSDGQGLALSLSSQYQPQTSSLHLHSGRQELYADVEMNTVATMSPTAQTAGGVANNVIMDFSSRSYSAIEPKIARLSRFRMPMPKGDASKSAIMHGSELAGCGSAGRRDHLRPQVFEFYNGSKSDPADISRITNRFAASKFLRAAQELLVEVCRVVAPKRPKAVHNMTNWQNVPAPRNFSENVNISAAQTELAAREPAQIGLEISSAPLTLIPYYPQYVSQSLVNTAGNETREALLLKKENLLTILNEVEARHMRYREHFTVMMNSFNIHAGAETATPYLDLAFQTMSCHFRTVRNATRRHLRVVTKALGEEEFSRARRGETSGCHHVVDHQLHYQQQALHNLGILQQHQSWRPQRGLPERAVTILRDWMTKHFLHPYPKDADKLSLARQTCLTRSQVSNWFINARVRLWKPMVEEMYTEEQRMAAQEASERRQLAEAPSLPSKSLELFRRKLY